MLKNITLLAITAIILTSCSNKQNTYIPPTFTDWQVNEQTCMLENTSNGFKIQTDGRLSADYIYFKIFTPLPLARTPSITTNNIETLPIRVEGTGRIFSFEIPFTPYIVSKLINKNSFIIIDYRIQNIQKPKRELFNTVGLAEGVNYLAEHC